MRRLGILAGAVVVTLVAAACASPAGSGSGSTSDTINTTADVVATTTSQPPDLTAPPTTTVAIGRGTTTTTAGRPVPASGVARISPDRARDSIPSFRSEVALPVGGGDALTLTLSRDGDFEWTNVATGAPETLYDARTLTQVSTPPGGVVLVRTGVIVGGPDWPAPYMEEHRFFQSLAARAIEEGSGTSVDIDGNLSVEIRETWEPTHHDGRNEMLERVFAVDVATGLLTKFEMRFSLPQANFSSVGGVTSDLVRDEASFISSKAPYDPREDSGVETLSDAGFIPIGSLDEASRLAGYDVPPPGFVPDGFALTQIAYGADPASYVGGKNVVALTYMNAGWAFTVTYRDKPFYGDPFDPAGDFGYEDLAVEHGAFTLVPAGITHAYGTIDGRFITVDGGIGLETLREIVDGLG